MLFRSASSWRLPDVFSCAACGHPPLYYFMLHGWMNVFGSGDIAVRALSGVISVLTLPLAWWAARRRGGRVLALITVSIVALTPFALRYATETRMYALVILFVLAGYLLVDDLVRREYSAGFVTDIESDKAPKGLSEDTVRFISAKKNEPEWMLEWRLKAYRHWLTMKEPTWQNVHYPPIDYQASVYFSAPKQRKDAPKSLAEVDPKLLETYEKLGVPLHERAKLAGVAVDAVFDSVSVSGITAPIARKQRAAALRNRLQQFPEERGVHSM